MYTQSLIQQRLNWIHTLESFKNDLNDMMNKYIIEDAFFGISNNSLYEATKGYFVNVKEYTSLDEAVREMKPNQLIHVLENKTFIVGDAISSLSESSEDAHIYDIEFLCEVR